MSIVIDRASRDITESKSPIDFATTGDDNWPVWDRYLTVDGKQAYHLGNRCDTCAFLFERMDGANQTIDVGQLAGRLEAGIERLDDDLVDGLGLLMPVSSYRVALLRIQPRVVTLGSREDYFAVEQVENEGHVDPFWGLPHHPKVPYYRADKRAIAFSRSVSGRPGGTLFEFIVPMFPEQPWLDQSRIEQYEVAIGKGAMPTAVAISILDVKGPATVGIDHWCLAHFLLDGHHKVMAAARRGRPLTLISFLAADRSIAEDDEIEAALNVLKTAGQTNRSWLKRFTECVSAYWRQPRE